MLGFFKWMRSYRKKMMTIPWAYKWRTQCNSTIILMEPISERHIFDDVYESHGKWKEYQHSTRGIFVQCFFLLQPPTPVYSAICKLQQFKCFIFFFVSWACSTVSNRIPFGALFYPPNALAISARMNHWQDKRIAWVSFLCIYYIGTVETFLRKVYCCCCCHCIG